MLLKMAAQVYLESLNFSYLLEEFVEMKFSTYLFLDILFPSSFNSAANIERNAVAWFIFVISQNCRNRTEREWNIKFPQSKSEE